MDASENSQGNNSSSAGEQVISGVVSEALPNALFRVKLADGRETICYLAGKMRLHRIKVLVGDKVELILSPDGCRGRIVRRN